MRRITWIILTGMLIAGCNKNSEGADPPEPIEQDDKIRKHRPGGEGRLEEPPEGLVILENNRWKIPEDLKKRWEDHPNRLGTAKEHNKGYKLTVRENTPGWWLGLRTGDVVTKVNDLPIDTKAQLLTTWMKVKGKDRLVLKIRRDGEVREHTYIIVD